MLKFITSIILSFIPGWFGRLFSPSGNASQWYDGLIKSFLNPPGFVFGIIWPILYLMLAIAFYLVIKDKNGKKLLNPVTILFGAHLILNGLWSFIFFGAHLPILGAINIALLITVSIIMQRKFAAINRFAGYLIIPYIAWLCFALYLNTSIIFLN